MSFASRDSFHISGKSLMANYGVFYVDENGDKRYQELLNPKIAHSVDETVKDGVTFSQYKIEDISLDLSGSDKLVLVQSYSVDTLKDSIEHPEYITEMSTYPLPTYIDKKGVRLHIEVDRKNEMHLFVNGNQSPGESPARIDVNSELNKLNMWPTIFYDEK